MIRFTLKIIRYALLTLLGIVILFALLSALTQSAWGKQKIRKELVQLLEKQGIQATISQIEGQLPFSWKIESVECGPISMKQVRLRIALLPLLKGKCTIDYIEIREVNYTHIAQEEKENRSIPLFSFYLNHLRVEHFTWTEQNSGKSFRFGVEARGYFAQKHPSFGLKCRLFSEEGTLSYVDLSAEGSLAKNEIKTSCTLHLPLEQEVHAFFSLKGPWDAWMELMAGAQIPKDTIQGILQSSILGVHFSPYPELHGNWEVKSTFSLLSLEAVDLRHFLCKKENLSIKGSGTLQKSLETSDIHFGFSSEKTPSLFSEEVSGKGIYQRGLFQLDSTFSHFCWHGIKTPLLSLKTEGKWDPKEWNADVDMATLEGALPFALKSHVDYKNSTLSLSNFSLFSEQDFVKADLSYDLNSFLVKGQLNCKIDDISRLDSVWQDSLFHGAVALEALFSIEEQSQAILLSFTGSYLQFEDILVDDLFIKAQLTDPLGSCQGGVYCLAENLLSPQLYIDRLLIQTESQPDLSSLFSIDVEGRTNLPFYLAGQGVFKKENSDLTLTLSSIHGVFADIPLLLNRPSTFKQLNTSWHLEPFDMTMGEGHLLVECTSSPELFRGKLSASHFPLSLLSPLKPDLNLAGFVSSTGSIEATSETLQASWNTSFEEISLSTADTTSPLCSKGSFQVHLEKNRLQTFISLCAKGDQFLESTLSLPITYTLSPFTLSFNSQEPVSGTCTMEGQLQDLLDFVNLGTNHFGGWLSSQLFLSNTLASPSLTGHLSWEEGSYENDFTGIRLSDISAELEAKGQTIDLISLSGKDSKEGKVRATGSVMLKAPFTYEINAEMDNLHAVDFDMIDSRVSGPLQLTGNLQEITMKGDLNINSALVRIGERLPYDIPHIPFTYVHKPQTLPSSVLKKTPSFTFHMDIDVTADKTVIAEGKGVQAQLGGNMHLKGTNASITASGSLDLVKGEYQFAGKIFKLTEGHLLFNDKSSPFAYLNVQGELSLADSTITITLRGPITSPQLSFHSNPQKPTSAILALILFDKDISEINQMEALQLASTLISLSGSTGPDLLESIRKTLGVDRLNISSASDANRLPVEVQIGKYLTKGVMVTLVQSETSSRVIVEVEIPKGFVFQAETQENQEGKFSLKWRKNY
ncbi:MAG: hypothetical protein RLZZ453_216 [Chlamydiota bacterium]|jgi:hypothetical protein